MGRARTLPSLVVRYRGGTLDGRTRVVDDDQVPAHVATSTWERYALAERRYNAGVLASAVYVLES